MVMIVVEYEGPSLKVWHEKAQWRHHRHAYEQGTERFQHLAGRRGVQGFVIEGIERERERSIDRPRGGVTHRWPEHERRRKTGAHSYSHALTTTISVFDRQVATSGRRGQTDYSHGRLRPFSGRCFDNQEPEGASGVCLDDLMTESETSKRALWGGGRRDRQVLEVCLPKSFLPTLVVQRRR